jgi:hypothetical protein
VWPAASQLSPAAQSFVEMLKGVPSVKAFGRERG